MLSFLTRFFWNSAVLWYFAFWSKDHKLVTGCHRGLCIRLQHKEKERIEVVSRPLVAMYLLQSDLQLRRAGLNDHGNSFSNFFSSGFGKECVSSAWIRGQPFLQHPKYYHPLKKTMCAKQHICGTFKSNQLLPQSWHCWSVEWCLHGWDAGFTGNIMLRSSLSAPATLLSLFWQGFTRIYSFERKSD